MHNNTLIFTHIVVFESDTWSVFNKILLETLPSCIKMWSFGVFFQKYQENNRPTVVFMVNFPGF